MLCYLYHKIYGAKILAEKYLPLYRKYRPKNFNEVVGQEVIVKTLLNAIEYNRVAHAYLFCGPRGTGKTSIARIFAKTLNCLNPQNGIPCDKCAHCIDMNNTISMDVIEIDAASNRKVEDARNLLEKVQFTPILGKNKIYIIDEVHMLTTEAFNTLLKTLEEPPENLVFILATTESHKVMETIVSRCQKFDFKRISIKDITNRLKEISEKENIKIENEALEFIARRSAGGLRDALALLDQSTVLAFGNKIISKKDIVTLLGSIDDEDLYELTDLIAKKNLTKVINRTKIIVEKGNDPNQIIKELIGYFRNLMLASVCQTKEEVSELLDISSENCEKILHQSKNFSPQELVQILQELSIQEKNIRNSSNPYLWLDVAIIDAASRENILAQKAILERIENIENQLNQNMERPISQTFYQNTKTVNEATEEKRTPKEEKAKDNNAEKADRYKLEPEETTKISFKKEKDLDENKPEKKSIKAINLNWETFLGELQTNPAIYALVKTHAKPITTTSELIELAFRNEIFIEKIKQKQTLLETISKKLCGQIPKMIFRKISDDDFKKKSTQESGILTETKNLTKSNLSNNSEEKNITKSSSTEFQNNNSVIEDYKEIQKESKKFKSENESIYDLPDETKQIIEIFSGKIID